MNRKNEFYNRSYEKMAEKANHRMEESEHKLNILNFCLIAAIALITFSVTMTIW